MRRNSNQSNAVSRQGSALSEVLRRQQSLTQALTFSRTRSFDQHLRSQGQEAGIEPRSARDLYSTLPQWEEHQAFFAEEKQTRLVESHYFGLFTAVLILVNTCIIAAECQDLGNEGRAWMYHNLEVGFAAAYVVEIVFRIWQHSPLTFFCNSDPAERGWNMFDFVITFLGLVDVICNAVLDVHVNAIALRLLRVLRIMRVFRILRFLKDVEYTLVSAMGSVIRVMFLVTMIDFIGGVVITHILHDTEDEVVKEMFSKLSTSMFHLFEVMVDGMGAVYITTPERSGTPGGMVIITDRTMSEYPAMWMFWVVFVFIGTISLMALVPAIFVELNLRDSEIARQQQVKKEWEDRVEKKRVALELIFHTADEDNSNSVSREEMDKFLSAADVLRRLGLEDEEKEEPTGPTSLLGTDLDDEDVDDKIDVRQLQMEFTMVYDELEAQGRTELSCEEFIDAFRKMRAKPMDQIVVCLQQEIFKLRTLMIAENRKLQREFHMVIASLKGDDDEVERLKEANATEPAPRPSMIGPGMTRAMSSPAGSEAGYSLGHSSSKRAARRQQGGSDASPEENRQRSKETPEPVVADSGRPHLADWRLRREQQRQAAGERQRRPSEDSGSPGMTRRRTGNEVAAMRNRLPNHETGLSPRSSPSRGYGDHQPLLQGTPGVGAGSDDGGGYSHSRSSGGSPYANPRTANGRDGPGGRGGDPGSYQRVPAPPPPASATSSTKPRIE